MARIEEPVADGEPDCVNPDDNGDDDADEAMAVRDATTTEGDDEYVNPLMVDSNVGDEARMDEEIDEVLDVEFALLAAVRAATTDGSLLTAALDAGYAAAAALDTEDAVTASTATAAMVEAKGYAGTVKSLGKGGTAGTDGNETLGTAGTDGTTGRATTAATVGSTSANGTNACDGSDGVEGTAGGVATGRDAMDGICGDATDGIPGVAAASAAAATAVGTETLGLFVICSAWLTSVGAVESGWVIVVWATTFPAVSTVATTSTLMVLTLVPA